MALHGRVGTRGVWRAAAFPRAYLYSGRPNAGRTGRTQRLQHQASQAGKERTEQLLQRAVRKKRFLKDRQSLRSRRQHQIYAQIHRQERRKDRIFAGTPTLWTKIYSAKWEKRNTASSISLPATLLVWRTVKSLGRSVLRSSKECLKQTKSKEVNNMEAMTTVQKIFYSGEDCEKNYYFFSPSISKRKTVGKKTYYVRRFFTGGKNFEKTMERLAVQQG